MLSVIMVLKIKIKTQRNKNHKKNNLHFFAKLFINIQFITSNGTGWDGMKWNAVHVTFKDPDEWNRNAVAMKK